MNLQPNRNYVSNDDVQTPPALARRLVQHFQPVGRILEPCSGDGNFLKALRAHARAQSRRSLVQISKSRRSLGEGGSAPDSPRTSSSLPLIDLRSPNSRLRSPVRALSSQPNRVAQPLRVSALSSTHGARVFWTELKRNRNFFSWSQPVDWIITNPPWSQVRGFLQHALCLADHVVFLLTINHLWTRARLRDMKAAGFGLKEIVMVDMPKSFPQLGFQLGAIYLARDWTGPVTMTDWTAPADGGAPPIGGPSTVRSETAPDPVSKEIREINRRLDELLA